MVHQQILLCFCSSQFRLCLLFELLYILVFLSCERTEDSQNVAPPLFSAHGRRAWPSGIVIAAGEESARGQGRSDRWCSAGTGVRPQTATA